MFRFALGDVDVTTKVYSETFQTSVMKLFWKQLTAFSFNFFRKV